MVLFSCLLFIWLAPLYYPISATMFQHKPTFHLFWKLIPIEALILWGVYAGLSVLNAVRNVKDYPEAKAALMKDIEKARDQLTKAGFDWS